MKVEKWTSGQTAMCAKPARFLGHRSEHVAFAVLRPATCGTFWLAQEVSVVAASHRVELSSSHLSKLFIMQQPGLSDVLESGHVWEFHAEGLRYVVPQSYLHGAVQDSR